MKIPKEIESKLCGVSATYYQLLTTLPDVRFTNNVGDPDYNPIPFTFTGGVGVLMPFRVG